MDWTRNNKANKTHMNLSLQERRLRIVKRLELTLGNTHLILDDVNNKIDKLLDDNMVLERVADAYEVWSRKSS